MGAAATERVDNSIGPYGILIVEDEGRSGSIEGRESEALGHLQDLADSDIDNFGYGWFNRETLRLVLDIVADASSASRAKADELIHRIENELGLVVERRIVSASQRALEKIKNQAIELSRDAGHTESGVYLTRVDNPLHRVVVVANMLTDKLAAELVERYGNRVAVQVEKREPSMPQSRQAGTSPFWGGAAINSSGCTVGFPWRSNDGTKHMMVTAGHCKPNGPYVGQE